MHSCRDKDSSTIPYDVRGDETYDDARMRIAAQIVSGQSEWQGGEYSMVFHNCQDFVSAVLEAYNRLSKHGGIIIWR